MLLIYSNYLKINYLLWNHLRETVCVWNRLIFCNSRERAVSSSTYINVIARAIITSTSFFRALDRLLRVCQTVFTSIWSRINSRPICVQSSVVMRNNWNATHRRRLSVVFFDVINENVGWKRRRKKEEKHRYEKRKKKKKNFCTFW